MAVEADHPAPTRVEISKRLLLVNSASSVVTKLISASVIVWLQQFLLRRISDEEYSLLPVISSVVVFLPLLTTVFSAGIGRYVTEAYARGDERRVTQIVSTMFPFHLATALAIGVVGCALAWHVDRVLTIAPERVPEARIMLGLMVFSLVSSVAVAPFSVGLFVRQKFMWSSAIGLGQEFLRIGLIFVLLFGVSISIVWLVVASVSANLCGLVATQVVSRRLVPALKFRLSEIRWSLVRTLTSFGGWTILAQLGEMIRTGSDPILLNKFSTPVNVNSFYIGSLPLGYMQGISYAIQGPLLPQMTAMHAADARDRLQSAYLRIGRYALWGALLLAVPLMVFSREVILLYVGDAYADAAIVMVLLLAVFPVAYGHVMLGHLANATAQMRSWTLRAVAVQLVNLALTLYLVGVLGMGAVGSALGTFLSMTLLWPVLNWPLGLRLVGLGWGRWFRETLVPGLVPAVVSAVVCFTLKFTVAPATWLALGLCAAAAMAVHGAVLWRFCLQPADRVDLAAVRTSLFRRWLGKTTG